MLVRKSAVLVIMPMEVLEIEMKMSNSGENMIDEIMRGGMDEATHMLMRLTDRRLVISGRQ
eukprot:757371-Hanusia_phi.AAC.6